MNNKSTAPIKLSVLYKQDPQAYLLDKNSKLVTVEDVVRDLLSDHELLAPYDTTTVHVWSPSAESMIDSYIECLSDDMYEDWAERAERVFDEQDHADLQAILDRAFARDAGIGQVYEPDRPVEIDKEEVERYELEREGQHVRWLELMDAAGISYHLIHDGISWATEKDEQAANELAREHDLHHVLEG